MTRRKHRGEAGRRVTAAYHRVMTDPAPLPPDLVAAEVAMAAGATDLGQPAPDAPGYPVQRMDLPPGEMD